MSHREKSPPWATPEQPDREASVFRHQLEKRAREQSDQIFVRFEDGTAWSFREALDIARRSASGLARLGLKAGDPFFIWMPGSPDFIRLMFGAHYLGATVASPNTAYRGGVLEHLVRMTDARIAAIHPGLLDRLDTIDAGSLRTLIVPESPAVRPSWAKDVVTIAQVTTSDVDPAVLNVTVEPWQPQYIIYTSGTTGPSKGVIVTYTQMLANAQRALGDWYGPGDSWLVQLPMFHLSGTMPYAAALAFGASVTMAGPFSVSTFWAKVARFKPTLAVLLGSMATLLEAQPASATDRTNSLKRVILVPLTPTAKQFGERFGVDVMTWYGSSEAPVPLQSEWNPDDLQSCGRLVEGFEARLVDNFDRDVPEGEVGELILRHVRPWAMSPGYWHNDEATARLWRNGWLHTGDGLRRSPGGNYYFVDRKKDAIRRRGENISSFEVERDVLAHPEVREAAAIGVPNPLGEDDVLIAVALKPESRLTPLRLFEYLRPRMAHFMLPRYVRIMDALPKTATDRPQKFVLREQGVTADTWDREQAGIVVKREKL